MNGTSLQLAELKILSCCATWYPSSAGKSVRGTDKRSSHLRSDYFNKVRKVDKNLIGIPHDEIGPLETRLQEFGEIIGLVFGAWAEGSEGVHHLIQVLAKARVDHLGLNIGHQKGSSELGIIVGQIRRRISLCVIKAQVDCLISKLHQFESGSSAKNSRRQWAIREDERMARERNAQWLRRVEGIQTLRKGFIKTA